MWNSLKHFSLRFNLVFGLLFVLVPLAEAQAGQIAGTVYNASSGMPIPGALVTLDQHPADGQPEFSIQCTDLGVFVLQELPAGTYEISASKAGYKPAFSTVGVAQDESQSWSAALVPEQSMTHFELDLDVFSVHTNLPIQGAQVVIMQWPGPLPADPADIDLLNPANQLTLTTNAEGRVQVDNLPAGYYWFEVSHPHYETIQFPDNSAPDSTPNLAHMAQGHHAGVAMKPKPSSLKVVVTGWNPVNEQVGPLADAIVEIRGVAMDPQMGLTEVLPVRQPADPVENGVALFDNLDPVMYELSVRRPGYNSITYTINPGEDGQFDEQAVELSIHSQTGLRIALDSPYAYHEILTLANIKVRGEEFTNTHGIVREYKGKINWSTGTVRSDLTKLLPGRYWVSVTLDSWVNSSIGLSIKNGAMDSINMDFWLAMYPVEVLVEVADKELKPVDIWLEPIPAVIRGHLRAVEELSNYAPATADSRVLTPITSNEVRFIQTYVTEKWGTPTPIKILKDEFATKTVATDENGNFVTTLIPGLYGVKIPDLPGYVGEQIVYSMDIKREVSGYNTVAQKIGWPYPDAYPYDTWDPVIMHPWLRVFGPADYDMELVLHRQFVDIYGRIEMSDLDFWQIMVTPGGVAYDLEFPLFYHDPAQLVLTGDNGDLYREIDPDDTTITGGPGFVLRDIRPGNYEFSITHPLYDFVTSTTGQPSFELNVPEWGAPGELPPLPPSDPALVRFGRRIYLKDTGASSAFLAQTTVQMKYAVFHEHTWSYDDEAKEWKYMGDNIGSYSTAVKLDAYPDLLWSTAGTVPIGLPCSVFAWKSTVYVPFSGGGENFHVYIGGPNDSFSPKPFGGLDETNALHFRAITVDGTEVPGLKVRTSPDNVTLTSGLTGQFNRVLHSNEIQVLDPKWSKEGLRHQVSSTDPLTVTSTITVRRQMAVSGTVTFPDGTPAPNASVNFYSRFGQLLGNVVTDDQGFYEYGLGHQPILIQVAQRGYYPQRLKFSANTPDALDITGADFQLQALPPPQVTTFTMDRFGLFLPGVLKSGDPTLGMDPDNAKATLTATWQLQANVAPVQYQLAQFDTVGTQGGAEQVTVQDEIETVILVDPRKIPEGGANIEKELPTHPLPQEGAHYALATQFIDDVVKASQKAQEPTFSPISKGEPLAPNLFQGKVQLWNLPAGFFEPTAIVISKMGAVAVVPYETPPDRKPLRGASVQPWAASMINLIGILGNADPGFDPSALVPKGKLIPLPTFKAAIGLDNGYVNYDFRIDVVATHGTAAPKVGLLGLGNRMMGLTLKGTALLTMEGAQDAPAPLIGGMFSLSKDFAQQSGLDVPGILSTGNVANKSGSLFELAELEVTGQGAYQQTWSPDGGSDFTVKTTAAGHVKARVDFNLTKPFLSKIPYIGPFILAADETGVAKFRVFIQMLAGALEETTWRAALAPTSSYEAKRQWYSFMGGLDVQKVFKLIWSTAAGIRASMLWDSTQVHGQFQLGAPNDTNKTGLEITLNTDEAGTIKPEWPPFKKVLGAASFVAGIKIKALGISMNRTWQYDLIPINWQLSTQPYFDLAPNGYSATIHTPFSALESQWIGSDGALLADLFEGGAVGLSSASGAMAYTQTTPGGTAMTIMVSLPSGKALSVPVDVASSTGVHSLDLEQLADGRYLLVWSQYQTTDLGKQNAPTTIMYTIGSPDGTSWLPPAELAQLSSVAHHLMLTSSGDGALLVYGLASSGLNADSHTIFSAWFDGSLWAPPQLALPGSKVTDAKLSAFQGSPPMALLGLSAHQSMQTSDKFSLLLWEPDGWSTVPSLPGEPVDRFTKTFAPDGTPYLVTVSTIGNLSLHYLGSNGVLQFVSSPLNGISPYRLAALAYESPDGANRILVVWSLTGVGGSVNYVVMDGQGVVVVPTTEIELPGAASIDAIELFPLQSEPETFGIVVQSNSNNGSALFEVLLTPGQSAETPPDSPEGPTIVENPEQPDPGGDLGQDIISGDYSNDGCMEVITQDDYETWEIVEQPQDLHSTEPLEIVQQELPGQDQGSGQDQVNGDDSAADGNADGQTDTTPQQTSKPSGGCNGAGSSHASATMIALLLALLLAARVRRCRRW